ncbi:MAG: 30S ribosomal protein S15 [Planctomycetota bacterium]|nr:30S ribosomal protein S15 [Planctomycetota bacterium]
MAVTAEQKKATITKFRRHEKDSGSAEVQIANLTDRIQELSGHLSGHAKDHHSRRGLVMMVSKRNRLLKYFARVNPEGYKTLIGRLGLRK